LAALSYTNFDLLISRLGDGYTVKVINSPAGETEAQFQTPFTEQELEIFYLKIGRPRRGVRRLDSPELAVARSFGGRLFKSVFGTEVREFLHRSLDLAGEKGLGLRIRLRLTAPELVVLPWEYLYDPSFNNFLVLSVHTPLVRYLELPQRIQPLTVTPPLRILVMISSPVDYRELEVAELDVDQEWTKLNKALADLQRKRLVELQRMPKATLSDLRKQLRQGTYHIFHFIGHGGFDERTQDGVLLLEDEARRGRRVSGHDLATQLHNHSSLRLAILNACEGARTSRDDIFAGTAQGLVQQGMSAVIAMQFEITDKAAITFAEEFYTALADGYPVDAALVDARVAIRTDGNDVEWGTPVLYMRSPDGRIFDIEPLIFKQLDKNIASLYRQSQEAIAKEDWETVINNLEEILAIEPTNIQIRASLNFAQQEKKMSKLYDEGLMHYKAKKYSEALDCFRRVRQIKTNYKEVENLISTIEKTVKKIDLQNRISFLFREAQEATSREDWKTAIVKFQKILTLAPNHIDTKKNLSLAQKSKELATLYAECQKHYENKKWHLALKNLKRLRHIQPHYKDVDTLLTVVQQQLQVERETSQNWRRQRGRILIDATISIAVLVLIIYLIDYIFDGTWEKVAGRVYIPAGYVMMGSNDGKDDEMPVHKVYVEAFYMDKYEVTVAEYEKFVNAKGYQQPYNWTEQLKQPQHPVVNVSWEDAGAYARWKGKRLPTEAEWEYAARGGYTGLDGKPSYKYPWGNNESHDKANYGGTEGNDQWERTAPVGSFAPNGYGLYDMAGNVWEWCADWYDENYYQNFKNSTANNPKGPDSGTQRVLRGGSWDNVPSDLRCANRRWYDPSNRVLLIGFRCVRDVR